MNVPGTKCKRLRTSRLLPAALLMVAVTACLSPVDNLPVVLWEVQMEGELEETGLVAASVAMVASDFVTQIGIGVQGASAGVPLTWSVRQGTCENPGALVVDQSLFGGLELDSNGVADAELLINRRVDTRADYSAAIAHPEGGTLCRQMERLN